MVVGHKICLVFLDGIAWENILHKFSDFYSSWSKLSFTLFFSVPRQKKRSAFGLWYLMLTGNENMPNMPFFIIKANFSLALCLKHKCVHFDQYSYVQYLCMYVCTMYIFNFLNIFALRKFLSLNAFFAFASWLKLNDYKWATVRAECGGRWGVHHQHLQHSRKQQPVRGHGRLLSKSLSSNAAFKDDFALLFALCKIVFTLSVYLSSINIYLIICCCFSGFFLFNFFEFRKLSFASQLYWLETVFFLFFANITTSSTHTTRNSTTRHISVALLASLVHSSVALENANRHTQWPRSIQRTQNWKWQHESI